jgi:hypothetical protein
VVGGVPEEDLQHLQDELRVLELQEERTDMWTSQIGMLRVFGQQFTPEDAIGSHACLLEVLAGVRPMTFISGVHSSHRLALQIPSKH